MNDIRVESLEDILQVDHHAFLEATIEERGEASGELLLEAPSIKPAKAGACEVRESGHFLVLRFVGVGVEDALAKDIEDLVEVGSLVEVLVSLADDVLRVGGVSREKQLHAGKPWPFEHE